MRQRGLLPHMLPACAVLALALSASPLPAGEVSLSSEGYTTYGTWLADVRVAPDVWNPGDTVKVSASLVLHPQHLINLANDNIKADGFALLVTAERTFDRNGWIRLPSDEKMSTLLTPTGLPIEGGIQAAISTRLGFTFKSPFDQLVRIPLANAKTSSGRIEVAFQADQKLPADLPPGIYRVRLDYGVTVGTRNYSLNGKSFGYRQSAVFGKAIESHLYGPPVAASGIDVQGRPVFGPDIKTRLPWVLLNNYNSNGYRGVVAEEDQDRFAISSRNLIQDDVILPMYDSAGRVLSYSLEPQFLTDTIELRSNIPWDYNSGAITVEVTAPDGKVSKLGTFPYAGQSGQWPSTKNSAVTAWKPALYGQYAARVTGWIADRWGRIYHGGGTYRFWIANRMTMATATFQGMAYPVGTKYGRDIGFAPAFPADVEITADLFPYSDPAAVRSARWSGKASPAGIYGAAQGAQNLTLDAPGEYRAHILARYTDSKGNLWVCSMRHAGVVYAEDSPIVARGKKLSVGGKFYDRGETWTEGSWDMVNQMGFLVHLNYPWQSGDVLLIASEGQTANKIIPVLTWESREKPQPYETRLNGISATNVQLKTSNGYPPHLYPEFITDWAYFYAGAPRPGFMSRFLVGEDGIFAPYWPTSPNSFGGQINASNNGDMPGDIYRLIGGVVLRRAGEQPSYAGYLASSFIIPGGTNNNRVIAPGSEDLLGSTGEMARFFMVGTRPGMMYETGAAFTPAVQIDPIVPANLKFTLRRPDGQVLTGSARGDAFGSAVGPRWTLDIPGIYRYHLEGEWNGYRGLMPGLPREGGDIYVVESGKPKDAPEIQFNLAPETSFDPVQGLRFTGTSTASEVSYAAVIPGAVIGQGTIPVNNGKFDFFLDPAVINRKIPTYDIAYRVNGKPEIFDVIHLTFFSREKTASATTYHSFARLIIRGTKVIYAK